MFSYDDAVAERFPSVQAGVIEAHGVVNGPSPADLLADYRAEQRVVADKLASGSIAELPSIAAWRRVFAGFGSKPTQYRCAAEALLRRLAKHGDIPTINTLVDIGNVVSIRHALPVAVVDRAGVIGPITVQFATGRERFTDLGADVAVHPDPGEVVFVDREGVACARRWCWRQSAQSATTDATVDALIIVEGHHDTAQHDVLAAVNDLVALLAGYQPRAQTAVRMVSADRERAG